MRGTVAAGLMLAGLGIVANAARGQLPEAAAPAADASLGPATASPPGKLVASIVARVDEKVILLSEVISPVKSQLTKAKAALPPQKYREFEWQILRQVTESRIQRLIVMAELQDRFKEKGVMDRIRKGAAEDFDKYLLKLARENGLKTRDEIIDQLKKEGASITDLRDDFIENMLAQGYVSQLVKSQVKEPTRAELVRYYQDHQEDFRNELGAVWSHIEVKFKSDQDAARAKIQQASDRLSNGEAFAEVAKSMSEGPTAIAGGAWSLTSKGSYADPAVDEAIFTAPVGVPYGIIEGKTSYHIIKVEKRSDGEVQPFAEVQTKIGKLLADRDLAQLRKVKFDELRAKHHIETVFDGPIDGNAAKPAASNLR